MNLGEPRPFTHLGVPNAGLYRSLLRTFARAKERFIVHLRPEDVAAELRIDADEQLTLALEQLVAWGNLRADADTSRVTTVEDFHRKRSLYQRSRSCRTRAAAGTSCVPGGGRRGPRRRGRRRIPGPGGETGARRLAEPVARAG